MDVCKPVLPSVAKATTPSTTAKAGPGACVPISPVQASRAADRIAGSLTTDDAVVEGGSTVGALRVVGDDDVQDPRTSMVVSATMACPRFTAY